ncbi:copper resistance CopC family protein [Actinacidiphila glaucinigra]|uniref:copper resistance CopC family protein n=1 Tax=Actinacidiphila glaucinigra TaxID=235986 RepID=UPI003D8C98E6
MVFDQPVALTGSTVRLTPAATFGAATLNEDTRTVTLPLRGHMATGVRTVDWQVTARDGDMMTGSYRFAVGPHTVALHSGQATAAKDASVTAVLRWLMFAALALLLGELTGRRIAPGAGLRRWAPATALTGTATALALAALLARDGSLLDNRPGILALVETGGFFLAALAVFLRRDARAVVPLSAVLVAEALRAHPQTGHPVTGALLTFVHLVVAALWVGTWCTCCAPGPARC